MTAIILNPAVTAFDRQSRMLVREARHPALDRPMKTLSRVGSGYVQLPVAIAVCVILWRRHRRLAESLIAVAVATVVTVAVLKWLIGKPRPNLTTYAFPSGHVMGTLVFSGVVLYLLWIFAVHRRWQVLAGAGCTVMILGVAYSRLYVNAHWLTDVMGAVAGGIAVTTLGMLLIDHRIGGQRPG